MGGGRELGGCVGDGWVRDKKMLSWNVRGLGDYEKRR